MTITDTRLAYMAGQILRNFAARGHDAAIAATAEHIALFWDPGMKARARALLDDPAVELGDDLRAVFARLRRDSPAGPTPNHDIPVASR